MKVRAIVQIFREHGILLDIQGLEATTEISGKICADNRKLEAGDIFVCIRGFTSDGHKFIPDARKKQAAAIVCEDEFADKLPAIRVSDSRKANALLAKLYYRDPSSRFRLVGITGTNGKTTTSLLLFKAVSELGFSAGWIGTLGYYINDRHYETNNTTPDILELNGILAQMADEGVQYVFMEVSSHALALDRVYGIEFDFCLFTNLTREHLDFHSSMEEYGATKLKLFESAVRHTAIALINTDDSFGSHIYDDLKGKDAFVFSVGRANADYLIRTDEASHSLSWEQSRFALQCPEGAVNIRSPLIGKFNIENLAMGAAALSLMGFEKRQIEQGVNSVKPVRGRFERVENPCGIGVFVDYAHTPDALENVLRASREFEHRRILCLFGAGGERDKGKRPLMLKAALQHADAVIITDDNPRREDPDAIIRDVLAGSETWLPWWIIRDRKEAIYAILRLARPGDVVLLCGKGHETYQEIGTERFHFDDHEIAAEFFKEYDPDADYAEGLSLPVDRLMLEILSGQAPQENQGYRAPCTCQGISTDSRTIKSQEIFFALRGPNFDGHAYLPEVLCDNSRLGIGDQELKGYSNYLQVEDTPAMLAALSRKYLLMFDAYKIVLTGSTGKSSTKEILAQVFACQAPTLKTEANENNLIGVCRTVARIRPRHRFAVFELGTNAPGEIAALSEVCSPDAGIIINIGPSHLAGLGDEDGVYKEKASLLNRPLDLRLFDADDERFGSFAASGKGVGYSEAADFRITDVICREEGCDFKLNREPYSIPYPAEFYVTNAAFAIATGLLKGIASEDIQAALCKPVRLDMRLQVEKAAGLELVIDCYNANPVSMQAAIQYWKRLSPQREHVAVLADMLELGDSAILYHDMVAAILADAGYSRLITVGEHSARYHGQDTSLMNKHFHTVEELLASPILDGFAPGSVVLVKGSHSMHLEKILPRLRGKE